VILEMENIKVSVEYINSNGCKGQVHSRVYYGEVNFYTMTRLSGGTFSTFEQADNFMKKLGYYKLGKMAHTKELADHPSNHGPKAVLNLYKEEKTEMLGVALY